jgi:hypothetical protein
MHDGSRRINNASFKRKPLGPSLARAHATSTPGARHVRELDPMPWQSMAVWMLTQMKRWGYVKGEVNYKQIAEKVFLITDAKKYMKELGQKTPEGAYPKFTIMGKEFDAAKAEQYAAGFAINKMT